MYSQSAFKHENKELFQSFSFVLLGLPFYSFKKKKPPHTYTQEKQLINAANTLTDFGGYQTELEDRKCQAGWSLDKATKFHRAVKNSRTDGSLLTGEDRKGDGEHSR